MLGSHNSLTYKMPTKWYLWPICFMGRCQKYNWEKQYKLGVRYFDMRVRFINNKIYIAHGMFSYDASDLQDFFDYMNTRLSEVWVNFTLEDRGIKLTENDKKLFVEKCKEIEKSYPKIHFVGGHCIGDGIHLYEFGNQCPTIYGYYSSVTSLFKSDNKILRVIDDLFPWLYARINTKKKFAEYEESKDSIILLDFVNML